MMRKNYFNLYIFPLFFIFFSFVQTTYAQCDQAIQAENSIWATGNYFIINMEGPSLDKQKITLFVHNLNNISIELEGLDTGNLKLLENKVLITQGIDSTDEYMIDKLDMVSLNTQFIISLLEVAVPEGPQLKTTKQIDIKEKDKGFAVGTMSASMDIPPPWELTGTVTPLENGAIGFDFKLHALSKNILIKGSWGKLSPAPPIDDNMSLDGWNMYTLRPRTFQEGKSTIFDYGTTKVPFTAKTLGELRQSLSKTQ